jgi:hypothetical protein
LAISTAALIGLLVYRHGFGTLSIPAPLEFATPGAPGATQSWFGLIATALATLIGFHPADVSSRLLSLWPLGMLAAFFVMGRRWSLQGLLLVGLAAAPFLTLMLAQLSGTPVSPPNALVWVATAVPVIVIGTARVIDIATGSWPRTRRVAVIVVALLAIALVDQIARVRPASRFDIARTAALVGTTAQPGDVIVYAPDAIGDVVHYYARPGVDVVPSGDLAARLAAARHVLVIGAFAFDNGDRSAATVGLVHHLASTRHLLSEQGRPDLKVWVFG